MAMTRAELDAFFARRERAWHDRDPDALAADHADDCIVESPTHGTLSSREAIRAVYATWFDAFPDLRFNRDDLLVEGDRAALFFTSTGTHVKPFASIPATGRHMSIRGVFVMTFRDGRIVHEKRYYDSTSLLLQIGVLKAKPM
jgi:steroid delta-isomerase-like uncharacterized protein